MPGIIVSSSPSSASFEESLPGLTDSQDYAANSFPGYAEKPLDEQLEPIAVVGMGCRLPGSIASPAAFWDLMMNKETGQTPKVPVSRFNIDAHYHKNNDRPGSFGVLGGYFLEDDLSKFDPGLFGITPIEAMWMDPQQRKLCEVVYEALESGGISLEAISGTRTAVFAASFTADWQQMSFKEQSFRHNLTATGVDPGIISNRISHVFNLNGPSIMCNTACSSSVYALHNACNSLRNREAEGAIVGGVNLIITVDQHMNTAKLGVLSPTSTCHTFDQDADGYGRADAVGAVYLKLLSDAIRDGDPIRGVIRSTAVNSNGRVPAVGITHPNLEGQADVISHAYQRGGDLDPRLTGYFECHGTGTSIGDPLEVHAVSMAMNKNRKPGEEPLMIGAVKTNIGHSEAASGLSALIKGIMIVERGVIAPTRGLVIPNPKIKWDEWQVKVASDSVPFPPHLPVRRMSVNSFGYGGTNAHIILEGADSMLSYKQRYVYHDSHDGERKKRIAPRRAAHRKRPFLLPFSAHDKPTLLRNIEAHAKVVNNYQLLDLSYTLSRRRSILSSRAFAITSHQTLESVFSTPASSFSFADSKKRTKTPTLGLAFTGQGAQWARMGAELIEYSSRFRSSIHILDLALEELHDGPTWSIEDMILEPAETSRVNEAAFSQPLCTAVQVALVQLLEHWGIQANVTVGHSSGEMAAAYAAGLISAREAITLAYYRGVVTSRVESQGAMMAVGLGAEAVKPYIGKDFAEKVVVACHNSPTSATVSGDADAIETLKIKLDAEGVFARILKTNGKAYHSHHMAAVSSDYERLVSDAKVYTPFDLPTANKAKMVSSVTTRVIPKMSALDEKYWSKNLRSPVLFNEALENILTSKEFSDVDVLIEIGPHSVLAGPIQQIKANLSADKLEYLPSLLRGTDSAARLLHVAGELFLRGFPVDMERVVAAYVDEETSPSGKRVPAKGSIIVDLPPYQWNYTKPLWAESRGSREHRLPKHPRHDVLGQLVLGSSLAEPTWRNVLRIRDLPWLQDHTLGGEVVFPAAGYFAIAIEAITQLNETSDSPVYIDNYTLRDVSIQKALVVPNSDDGIEVMTNIRPSVYDGGSRSQADVARWWDFNVSSVDSDGAKKEHMAGSISFNTARPRESPSREVPDFSQRASGQAWNDAFRDVGFDYGPTFQDMDDIRFDGKRYEASCSTNIKQQVDESLGESRYALHPSTVDSVLQLSIAAIYAGRTDAIDYGVVPIQLDEVTIWKPTEEQIGTSKANAYAWTDRRGLRSFETGAQMTAACDDQLLLEIVNLRTVSYEAAVPQKDQSALTHSPYGEMHWDIDIESLRTAADIDGLSSSDLAKLVLFKHPDTKFVELGSNNAQSILGDNPRTSYTIAVTLDAEVEPIRSSFKDYQNTVVTKVDLADVSSSLTADSYGVLLVDKNIGSISKLRTILKPGGYIFADSGTVMLKERTKDTQDLSAVPSQAKPTMQLVYRTRPTAIISSVKSALETIGWHVEINSLESCSQSGFIAERVIMLADFEGPLLFTITSSEFNRIQDIISSTSSLLWVTPGGLLEGKRPDFAMVTGLARTITSEQASLDFRTIDFDMGNVSIEQAAISITKVAQDQLAMDEEMSDKEYCVTNGKTYISRLIRNRTLNEVFSTSRNPEPKVFSSGNRLSGKIVKGKLVFHDQSMSENDDIDHGYVEVQIQASGLTREGVLVVNGSDYPTSFSHEIGGTVKRVGPGVTSLKIGDRVIGLHAETFSSYQQVPAAMLCKIEGDGLDLNTLVSTLTSYAAALYGLETLARVQDGEHVVILHNTGTSGVAAVKIAQANGAIPYVIVDSADESHFLQEYLGLKPEQILQYSADGSTWKMLGDRTNGHGADVVFSTGNADANFAREAWRYIARFGRFIDAGRKDVLRRKALDAVPAQRGASYMAFDVVDLLEGRPETLAALLPRIIKLSQQGSIVAPGPIQLVNLDGLDKAISSFSDAFGSHKFVVTYGTTRSEIPVLPTRPRLQFSPESTYLLVGCLGGLGRSLTSWMMESGARRFIFLSRSGTDTLSAAKLVKDIKENGADVQVIRGDATSRNDVVRAVQGVSPQHPIKGVVHAAMVLRDGIFQSMTFDNWKASVQPKVLGAANLHSVLSNEALDFFIMTSSVSGILGNPTQSNYAAANSYLDSLARHRRAANKAAISVILPMILGVGVVAENKQLEGMLKRKGMYGIGEEKLLESFEAALSFQDVNHGGQDHIVVGLDPAGLQKAASDTMETNSYWTKDARFSHVVHDMNTSGAGDSQSGAGGQQSILATVNNASSVAEAVAAVTEHFVDKLARMLLLDIDVFEPDTKSIGSYGVDSMTGAELRNWIFKEYRLDIPFQQLLAPSLTITKFTTQVCAAQGVEAA
ncbi:putative polyketide synthase [Leptodontidium sp. 2 PMI_412]|nr:putative polyketide synthase [Leptodontidium sp. 2 PMI_412]